MIVKFTERVYAGYGYDLNYFEEGGLYDLSDSEARKFIKKGQAIKSTLQRK